MRVKPELHQGQPETRPADPLLVRDKNLPENLEIVTPPASDITLEIQSWKPSYGDHQWCNMAQMGAQPLEPVEC